MNDVIIEHRILEVILKLLIGRVNDMLGVIEFPILPIEFGNYKGFSAVAPAVALASCERSEKERIIKLDACSLTITFNVPETLDSELHCYVYAWAVCKAIEENPTLGGVVDRAVISGKKYIQPKKANCGVGWEVVISLRVTVEAMSYE